MRWYALLVETGINLTTERGRHNVQGKKDHLFLYDRNDWYYVFVKSCRMCQAERD